MTKQTKLELLALLIGDDAKESKPEADIFFEVGKTYFIRTVTHHYHGTLARFNDRELVMSECAWIADDGRFAQAVAEGKYNEVEPFPAEKLVLINRASILDATEVAKMNLSQK